MSPEEYAEVAALKDRVKELGGKIKTLEGELSGALDGSQLSEGYDQCLRNIRHVVAATMEVTRGAGPAEGLTYLLARLAEQEVDTEPPSGMPYDWLSRWLVTDRVNA